MLPGEKRAADPGQVCDVCDCPAIVVLCTESDSFGDETMLLCKTHSEATKQKMREWNIGRKHTPETCAKISKLQKERCSSGAGHIHLTSIKQSIGVSVNDTVFPSIKAAARALGIHDSVVGRRCKSPNFKNFTFIPTE